MDSKQFWENFTMYNENVLKYAGDLPEAYYELDEEVIDYDDSEEWYNQDSDDIQVSEADAMVWRVPFKNTLCPHSIKAITVDL